MLTNLLLAPSTYLHLCVLNWNSVNVSATTWWILVYVPAFLVFFVPPYGYGPFKTLQISQKAEKDLFWTKCLFQPIVAVKTRTKIIIIVILWAALCVICPLATYKMGSKKCQCRIWVYKHLRFHKKISKLSIFYGKCKVNKQVPHFKLKTYSYKIEAEQ